MRLRITIAVTALILAPALTAVAADAADTRPAKIRPQLRTMPQTKTECPSGPVDPATTRGLRPQPEPPGKAGTDRPLMPGSTKGFNPQPEPPGVRGSARPLTPGTTRGFNPQPEPPAAGHRMHRPGELQGLNPQPEPPSEALPAGKTASPC